ncbi:MAG: hypothetical protein ABJP45_15790 [Cyclobacteriaceae bacterium]
MGFFRYFVTTSFEVLRLINKISLLFCFAFVANFAFADQYSHLQPDQEGEKRQITEGIDPSGTLEGGTEPFEDPEPTELDQQDTEQQSVDSTEDTSVSKHNFIFYFLYKLKYNENQEVQEIF